MIPIEKVDTNLKHERGFVDGISKAHKMDIDSNGLTDLLLDAIYPFENNSYVVMDLGNGNYQLCYLTRFIDFLHDSSQQLLVVTGKVGNESKNDTLIYKFGGFIEYNPSPEQVNVEGITLEATSDWTGNYELKIDSTRWATCISGGSIFAGEVQTALFNKINEIIGYMRLATMYDNYPIVDNGETDLYNVNLEVKLVGSRLKKIGDYGGKGTYGLMALYRQLFKLVNNLNEY